MWRLSIKSVLQNGIYALYGPLRQTEKHDSMSCEARSKTNKSDLILILIFFCLIGTILKFDSVFVTLILGTNQ